MTGKKAGKGVMAFIVGCLGLGIVITLSQIQAQKPLPGYVEESRTAVATVESVGKKEADPDMQYYSDNMAGLSLQVPREWVRVIKDGNVTFVQGDTGACIAVCAGKYTPGLAGITETNVREDAAAAGAEFISFAKDSNMGYTVRYQTIQENILYDNIEINRYDLNTAVRVSICVPDDAYKLLQKEISATVNSVSWEPRSPIPEEYLLIYNDFGAFEFAVPENWDRGIEQGEYVARDAYTGAEMHVSVGMSDATYENINQAVFAEYLAEGKEGFSIRQFSAGRDLIYCVSSYIINSFPVYQVDYLIATGTFEYGISFICPAACFEEMAGHFETAFGLFRTF